ncbi:MAG: hypothetical protein IMZ55_01265 [Acidobacteria bacterium]|nr:hypothetical protein [Acidobacteriota bacterium]MBE3132074.1 hypothetical protein [Acidobacteriota bacterium]
MNTYDPGETPDAVEWKDRPAPGSGDPNAAYGEGLKKLTAAGWQDERLRR